MALKNLMGRTEPEGSGIPAAPPRAPSPPATPASARVAPAVTRLDATTELTGTLRAKSSIQIEGRCQGEVQCDETVTVGETAVMRASIEADAVLVGGEVNGNITARRKVTLLPTARVTGDLITPGIVIEEGAKLEGRIMIGADQNASAPQVEKAAPEDAKRAAEPGAAKPRPPSAGGTPPPAV